MLLLLVITLTLKLSTYLFLITKLFFSITDNIFRFKNYLYLFLCKFNAFIMLLPFYVNNDILLHFKAVTVDYFKAVTVDYFNDAIFEYLNDIIV